MNSDELSVELGENLYEVKRMISGGFCAYGINDDERAMGGTLREALQNLLDLLRDKMTA
jgi:hypothetical protein